MKKRYQVVAGPDGVHWITIEPLIQDLLEACDLLLKIDTQDLTEQQIQDLNMKIVGVKNVKDFFSAILTELSLEQLREEKQNETTH